MRGDEDPSLQCCVCRRAHDPRSPNVDEAAMEDFGVPETVASLERVKFDSVSSQKGPLWFDRLEEPPETAAISIPSKIFRSVLGLRRRDGKSSNPIPLSRIVDSIAQERVPCQIQCIASHRAFVHLQALANASPPRVPLFPPASRPSPPVSMGPAAAAHQRQQQKKRK
ncbi:hypothetical protein TIFTF001_047034 [Ficus carica]|uniref:Uncharacterized protein n=1 Tax=Ficus carica TaxID=3494 RepID=A0AA87YQA8_FICCA|nr:hypothetical protein TIFTF001_047034 [Ficus carica]